MRWSSGARDGCARRLTDRARVPDGLHHPRGQGLTDLHSLRKLTPPAAVLALAACSSDALAAPDMDTSLDPVALDARTSDVDAVYEHPAMASLLQMSEMGGAPLSVNRALARTSETLRSHRTIVSGDARRPARPAFALAEYE